jgi:hypothetical protein
MRTPIRLATAHAHALPAAIAFEYPFATLRITAILACNTAGFGLELWAGTLLPGFYRPPTRQGKGLPATAP